VVVQSRVRGEAGGLVEDEELVFIEHNARRQLRDVRSIIFPARVQAENLTFAQFEVLASPQAVDVDATVMQAFIYPIARWTNRERREIGGEQEFEKAGGFLDAEVD